MHLLRATDQEIDIYGQKKEILGQEYEKSKIKKEFLNQIFAFVTELFEGVEKINFEEYKKEYDQKINYLNHKYLKQGKENTRLGKRFILNKNFRL